MAAKISPKSRQLRLSKPPHHQQQHVTRFSVLTARASSPPENQSQLPESPKINVDYTKNLLPSSLPCFLPSFKGRDDARPEKIPKSKTKRYQKWTAKWGEKLVLKRRSDNNKDHLKIYEQNANNNNKQQQQQEQQHSAECAQGHNALHMTEGF